MDVSQIPEPLRARMAELDAQSPVEKVGWLIRGHVSDTISDDEVRDELGMTARHSTRRLRQSLVAIDTLLTEEQPPGTLLHLVAGDGGRGLDDDPTDHGAAAYLRELADWVRAAIEQAERESGHR